MEAERHPGDTAPESRGLPVEANVDRRVPFCPNLAAAPHRGQQASRPSESGRRGRQCVARGRCSSAHTPVVADTPLFELHEATNMSVPELVRGIAAVAFPTSRFERQTDQATVS